METDGSSWNPMEPCGLLWILAELFGKCMEVAHPQGTVQNSIEMCTSLYKLRGPCGVFFTTFSDIK